MNTPAPPTAASSMKALAKLLLALTAYRPRGEWQKDGWQKMRAITFLPSIFLPLSAVGAPPPALITVTISPEARVKAAAEDGPRGLVQGGWQEFTIVIENTAGITAPLVVECQQAMTSAADTSRDRWLQFVLQPAGSLTGKPHETRTLRLWSRDAGVRTAVLIFNAGQGTQDLGFRSDVMLTFKVAPVVRALHGKKMDGRKMKNPIFLPSIFLPSKLLSSAFPDALPAKEAK